MIEYKLYKILHLLGVILLFLALGGAIVHSMNGGTKADNKFRIGVAASHGLGLFLILLSGFGMLARLGIDWPWPGWIYGKVVIWILFGALLALAYRKAASGKYLWITAITLGLLAAYLGVYRLTHVVTL